MSKDIKKAIAFGLIMGAILSLCNLCFATEPNFITVNGLGISSSGKLVDVPTSNIYYLEIEPGYEYVFDVSSSASYGRRIGFTNDNISAGVQLQDFEILDVGEGFSFNSNIYRYAVFVSNGTFNISRHELQGMDGFINDFAYSLSVNGVWDTVLACVPLIAICVLFGFGVFNIVRFLRLIIKTRGGM